MSLINGHPRKRYSDLEPKHPKVKTAIVDVDVKPLATVRMTQLLDEWCNVRESISIAEEVARLAKVPVGYDVSFWHDQRQIDILWSRCGMCCMTVKPLQSFNKRTGF